MTRRLDQALVSVGDRRSGRRIFQCSTPASVAISREMRCWARISPEQNSVCRPSLAGSATCLLREQCLTDSRFSREKNQLAGAEAADQAVELIDVGENPHGFLRIKFVKQAGAASR